jgi:cell division protein FtsQ
MQITGTLHHVTQEQLMRVVGRYGKGNFFSMNLVKVRDAMQKLPWVRNVSIRKHWPDKLVVAIEEHQALARWGDVALVNTHGELFQAAADESLPLFYGPSHGQTEVASRYQLIAPRLAQAGLKVAQLEMTDRHAWKVVTDKKMVIALGREELNSRLERFVLAYPQSLGQLKANTEVLYVDLRYSNGFAVRKPATMLAQEQLLQQEAEAKALANSSPKEKADNDKADKSIKKETPLAIKPKQG